MNLIVRVVRIVIGSAIVAGCAHTAASSPILPNGESPFATAPDAGFAVLYNFQDLPDGAVPTAGLIASNGTLYGTTQVGGKANAGSVFTTSTAGKENVIYDFGSGGPDGVFPAADLVIVSGTFYGTTSAGGSHGFGTVFKIDKSGNEHVIYNFKGGSDGSAPYARLAALNGVLYGTTLTGGGSSTCPQGCGTVFSVTPGGTEHVVHPFKGGSDGAGPLAPVIVVSSALYGTTSDGGKNGTGTIYKTSTSGSEQVLHSFGNSLDGTEPEAGLVSLGGKLYGTTNAGGKNFDGTVFVTSTTAGSEHVIYNFKGGSDGQNPEASLIAYKGKLYGTTAGGGAANLGTVFTVGTGGSETVLHAFKSGEGSDPRARLVQVNGQLYGTTSSGGKGFGTIFKASP